MRAPTDAAGDAFPDLPQEVLDAVEEIRARRRKRFEPDVLARLALPPFWTVELAERAGLGRGKGLEELLATAEASGLCERDSHWRRGAERDEAAAGSGGAPGSSRFWMPDPVRSEVLLELRREPGSRFLHEVAVELGRRISKAEDAAPRALARWAELAVRAKGGPAAAAEWLHRRVLELVTPSGDGPVRTADALEWLDAGEQLARVLGGQMETEVEAGRRRVELAYRRVQDRRHLEGFLERAEQVEAFRRLLDDSEAWALHFLGVGGVGKTMLVRYLTAELAPENGLLTTRVDFDYISPDYPARRPAQLLLALAEELRVYATTSEMEHRFSAFNERVRRLHESLTTEEAPPEPLAALDSEEFGRVLGAFVDVIRTLQAPVLLVLDTCEELAKLEPLGGAPPSLVATFRILEDLHLELPDLRVVFAGRRLLCEEGHGWTAAVRGEGAGGRLREAKPYLLLHVIRGFRREEAEAYLNRVNRLREDDALRDAVLARSPEAGTPAPVRGPSVEGDADRDGVPRYNPFDLALYARWIREEPELRAENLTRPASDPYVEQRVVRRLERDGGVRELLPAAVLLGRFDRDMIRPAFRGSDAAFAEAFRRLREQEWTEVQRDPAVDEIFVEVDRTLRPRLLRYLREGPRRGEMEELRRALAPPLGDRIRAADLRELGVTPVEAAVELLEPTAAAEVWDELERRVAGGADWHWAREITARLLAEEGAVGKTSHPLRAGIRALHAAAVLHLDPGVDLGPAWKEVRRTAAGHPDPETATWLRRRGLLGLARSRMGRWGGTGPGPGSEDDGLRALLADDDAWRPASAREEWRTEQLAASVCATLEVVIPGRPRPAGAWKEALDGWFERVSRLELAPPLSARIRSLRGLSDPDRRDESFPDTDAFPVQLPQEWLDWRAPDSFVDLLRLERVLGTDPVFPRPDPERGRWADEALGRLDTIDAERLLSLLLARGLAEAPPSRRGLDPVVHAERYDPGRRPRLPSHRSASPLFVVLARCLAACQEVEAAVDLVRSRLERSLSTRADEETVVRAGRALLRLMCDHRLEDRGGFVSDALGGGRPVERALALRWWALQGDHRVVAGIEEGLADQDPELVHAWWRSRVFTSAENVREAATALAEATSRNDLSNRPDLALDLVESRRTFEVWGLTPDSSVRMTTAALELLTRSSTGALPRPLWREEPDRRGDPGRTETVVRRSLRWAVLSRGSSEGDGAVADRVVSDVLSAAGQVLTRGPAEPSRRLAELALDEGEILALRLPARGAGLLEAARRLFGETGDRAGALRSGVLEAVARLRAGEDSRARALMEETLRPAGPEPFRGTGLLERYEALLAWIDEPAALLKRYAEVPGVPVELGGVLEAAVRSEAERSGPEASPVGWSPGGPEAAPADSAEADESSSIAVPLAVGIGGMTISLGVLVGTYVVFSAWVDSTFSPPGWVPPVAFLSLLAAVGFVPGVVGKVGQWIRRTVASRSRIVLEVRAPEDAAEAMGSEVDLEDRDGAVETPFPTATLTLRLSRARLRAAWPPITLDDATEARGRLDPPTEGSVYTGWLDAAPEPVRAPLEALGREASGGWLPVELRVDGALQPAPWEALVQRAVRPEDAPEPVTPRTVRVVPPRSRSGTGGSSREPDPWRRGGVTVLSGERWSLLLRNGWSAAGRKFGGTAEPRWILDLGEGDGGGDEHPSAVLHALGSAVRTTTGLRFAPDAAPGGESAQQKGLLRRSSSLLSFDEPGWIGAGLVVLQEEPAVLTRRFATDRARTADLRAYAARLAEFREGPVLLLPVLPPDGVGEVLAALARSLPRRRPPDRKELARAAAEVRARIAGRARTAPAGAARSSEGTTDDASPDSSRSRPIRRTSSERAEDMPFGPDPLAEVAMDVTLFHTGRGGTPR